MENEQSIKFLKLNITIKYMQHFAVPAKLICHIISQTNIQN
jgi:hypothetical protein